MKNPIYDWLREPGGLADRLLALREQAGLSGVQLAEMAGWKQSKVSRLENGNQQPTEVDLKTWSRVCGQAEIASELIDLLNGLKATHRTWKSRLDRGGHAAVQANFVKLTSEASQIRGFATAFMPGTLQTPEYARAVFMEMADLHEKPDDDIDAAVANRMQRQTMLYDTTKQFEFIVDESVLLRNVYGVDIMLAQLDRLRTVIGLSNVRFGVLPLRETVTTPQNTFVIFDDIAMVETFVGESAHDGDDAAKYHQVMNRLWTSAATGDAAQRLIVNAVEVLTRHRTP